MSDPVITDFELPSTGNTPFKLSDHRGKNVVVYFYPKDNTSGCTLEGQEFRDLYADFGKANTIVGSSSAFHATASSRTRASRPNSAFRSSCCPTRTKSSPKCSA